MVAVNPEDFPIPAVGIVEGGPHAGCAVVPRVHFSNACRIVVDYRHLAEWIIQNHGIKEFRDPKETPVDVAIRLLAAAKEQT